MSEKQSNSSSYNYRVVLAATSGRISGVDIFSINLARGLRQLGVEAEIVMTKPYYVPPDPMPYPEDVNLSKLPVTGKESWQRRWKAMIDFLEERAPCIYVPNYDWQHSCVSPKLSQNVGIVGIVHSDEDIHYEHVTRLGRYWNKIIAVSQTVAEKTAKIESNFSERLEVIPYGVVTAPKYPSREFSSGKPLKITYAGRIVSHQKRVFDLVGIMHGLAQRGTPFEFNIIGGGQEQDRFIAACSQYLNEGRMKFWGTLPNDQVHKVLLESDVFILTSEFEGLPLSMLEAMGHGCIPVVSAIESGIPEVVQDGKNGFLAEIGNVESFVEKLAGLQANAQLRKRLSKEAYQTIVAGGYSVMDMTKKYLGVFASLWGQVENNGYQRPPGKILPPPDFGFFKNVPNAAQKTGGAVLPLVRKALGKRYPRIRSIVMRFYWTVRPPLTRLYWAIRTFFNDLFWKIAKSAKQIVLSIFKGVS